MNREVIRIEEPQENSVWFTHELDPKHGWEKTTMQPKKYETVIYLGNCKTDGDMFAVKASGDILIFKGHLNSGKY